MFRYRLYTSDGDEFGEGTYAMHIKPDDEAHVNGGQRFHVTAVMPLEEADDSPFVAVLEVVAL